MVANCEYFLSEFKKKKKVYPMHQKVIKQIRKFQIILRTIGRVKQNNVFKMVFKHLNVFESWTY